jgi:hypothetical protein
MLSSLHLEQGEENGDFMCQVHRIELYLFSKK